jgi:hypothetical protein
LKEEDAQLCIRGVLLDGVVQGGKGAFEVAGADVLFCGHGW